jgi:hypothetical protein
MGDVKEKEKKKRMIKPQCYCLQGRVALLPTQKGVQGYTSELISTYALSLGYINSVSSSPPHSFDPILYTRKDIQDSFE